MNEQPTAELFLEPERYELHAAPLYHFELDRREFFRVLGGGVMVLLFTDALFAQEPGGGRRGGRGGQRPSEISARLHIGEDGTVRVFTGKAEKIWPPPARERRRLSELRRPWATPSSPPRASGCARSRWCRMG